MNKIITNKMAKSKYYYRKRRWRRRWVYTVGSGNYARCRVDICGVIAFPTQAGQPQIEFIAGTEPSPSYGLYLMLKKKGAFIAYGELYRQHKVTGIAVEITPSCNIQGQAPNNLVFGYCRREEQITFPGLSDSNTTVMVNPMGKTRAYWPLTNDWVNPEDEDDGHIAVQSMYNADRGGYPQSYAFKLSVYIKLRNAIV